MGIASIVLGILALLFALGGFLVSFVPVVGAYPGVFLSFTAPVLALMGIVLGGVGISRAREEGTETGAATAGLIVSIIAFFPAFLVAMTCGVCNTMCASAAMQGGRHDPDPWWMVDAGATPPMFPPPTAIDPPLDPDPSDPQAVDPGQPPPAFPPPPLPEDPGALPPDVAGPPP